METPRQAAARQRFKDAIQHAGGAVRVATVADIPQTHLSSVTSGKRGLGKETASKLRPWIQLSSEDWLDLLAPVEASEDVAHQCASPVTRGDL